MPWTVFAVYAAGGWLVSLGLLIFSMAYGIPPWIVAAENGEGYEYVIPLFVGAGFLWLFLGLMVLGQIVVFVEWLMDKGFEGIYWVFVGRRKANRQ